MFEYSRIYLTMYNGSGCGSEEMRKWVAGEGGRKGETGGGCLDSDAFTNTSYTRVYKIYYRALNMNTNITLS